MDMLLHGLIIAGYSVSAVSYIRHFSGRQPRTGQYATGFLLIGLLCHSIFLVIRTLQSGHPPFVGLHESMSFFAWLIAIVYLILEFRFQDNSLGAFVVPLILAAQIAAALLMRPEDPLPPLLNSPWFNIHVTVSFMAYAAFFFSFITGLLYVMQLYYLHRRRVGLVFARLPSLEMLDEMNLKATSIGWVFLTVGIGTGTWWALEAWHAITPWLGDPKVFCVALTWIIYTAQLVARYMIGWQGQRAAYLALVGFASVLVAYIGAGLWTNVHIF